MPCPIANGGSFPFGASAWSAGTSRNDCTTRTKPCRVPACIRFRSKRATMRRNCGRESDRSIRSPALFGPHALVRIVRCALASRDFALDHEEERR